ncbi:hypothetical protein PQR67_03395 [Paraburkholderia fungorum]|uniref:hypothetical protein n=1 Tax=Paraburkholderia fungorum TaxID=134537 RepID=UPI0038BA0C0D
MKKVSQLSKAIAAQKATIDQLQANRNLEQKQIDALLTRTTVSDGLRVQIQRLKAQALADGKTVDTSTLEAQLAKAEEQRTAAIEAARVSAEAIETIDAGLGLASAALGELEAQAKDAVTDELMTAHDAHQQRYVEAVQAMQSAVIGMAATERAWHFALRNTTAKFPGYGAQLLADLRDTGVRVPWSASRLRDPAVAAGYVDGYQTHWFMPEWIDPQTFGVGDKETAEFVTAIQKTGFKCAAFTPAVPPASEKMVMVRVLRGVIQKRSQKRTAAGVAIVGPDMNFGPGQDVEIEERSARHLQKTGHIAIHGEDDLPTRREEPQLPERIDAIKTDHNVSFNREGQSVDRYRGNFHALDLAAYAVDLGQSSNSEGA